jgi:hypothetical protein
MFVDCDLTMLNHLRELKAKPIEIRPGQVVNCVFTLAVIKSFTDASFNPKLLLRSICVVDDQTLKVAVTS